MANKSDLVVTMRENMQCTWREAQNYAEIAVSWIAGQIASGEPLELRGLGSFSIALQKGGANNLPNRPRSADHYKVKFKPARELKKELKKQLTRDKKNRG